MLRKWSEVLTIVSGKNQKDVESLDGKYPIYGSGGIMGYASHYLCEAGTTIVGRKGTINKPIFVNEPFWNVDTAFGITPGNELCPKYLYYFCCSFNFKELDKSTTIPSLAKRDLLQIEMPVPSLSEQERIVSKIEELFSKLDASVAELKTAKEKLKVYRQAVLKEAFASVSKECISLGSIIEKPKYGTSKKCNYTHEKNSKAVYRIPNIYYQRGTIDHSNIKYATFSDDELQILDLAENDLLIIRSNGSVSLVGRSAIVKGMDCDATFAGYLMRLRLKKPSAVSAKLLHYFLESHVARIYIEQVAKSTSGVNNINSNEISNLPVPKCNNHEIQNEIIEKIETNLSVCDSIGQTIDTSLQQAEALRQSILKQAFEGRLS